MPPLLGEHNPMEEVGHASDEFSMATASNTNAATSQSAIEAPQTPDGGLHAWLYVLGCFLVFINIW